MSIGEGENLLCFVLTARFMSVTFINILYQLRDNFDSGEDDFFNSPGRREGRQWHREEDMTGIPHDPNWGPRSESLINDNYESRRGGSRSMGRRPPDFDDFERRPPPRGGDGRMGPPPMNGASQF